ncbi:hypothetical protein NDU88_008215 [Pleurodeles waltl]|uniref:Uncharacterized protein n=1 Tax=Pleurodeles waltl TaxID=8319 RepID=A0AAV7VVZ4_PLEWA|nr:hypothetical protein NDU88_008215 [Pleurodeles waltl]
MLSGSPGSGCPDPAGPMLLSLVSAIGPVPSSSPSRFAAWMSGRHLGKAVQHRLGTPVQRLVSLGMPDCLALEPRGGPGQDDQ